MPSDFEREIHQQPEVLGRLVETGAEKVQRIAERLRAAAPRFVVIAARGTSDNAATYAKYLFGALNGRPVALAAPSLHTLYHRPPDMRGGLVIGISQSGQGADVCAVLESAKGQGAFTLALTNAEGSPLARIADEVIGLRAGEEKSVAASKTYTAELAAIALLAAHWNGDPALAADLSRLGDLAEAALRPADAARDIAARFQSAREMVVVARGYNQATAAEIALKIKELAYVFADPYSAADFRHGPIALVERGFPALAVAPQGAALADMLSLMNELREQGADLAVISNDEVALAQTELRLPLPPDLPEWLSPIVAVIPGQLLALHLTVAKGYAPDHPRRLRKVTITK